jgi:predicted nicotinamide N-methyase
MLDPIELFPEVPNLYEFPSVHADMLFDDERVSKYAAAIAATVKEGDIVADIGTGTGLLAFMCLDAGATRVHAIERSAAITWARILAERNGYADRVIFHDCDSRSIRSLPEPVDVVVSELIGHVAFEEGMLESLFHARQRFLRRGGRMIPRRAELKLALVTESQIYPTYIDRWRDIRGIDYSPMRDAAVRACYLTTLRHEDLLSEPATFIEVDLERGAQPDLFGTTELAGLRNGMVNGVGLWFNAELAPRVGLSSGPLSRTTHWQQCFAPIEHPIPVAAGDRLLVQLKMTLRETPEDSFVLSVAVGRGG